MSKKNISRPLGKIKIYTLGCKVNQYDSGELANKLLVRGFLLVEKNADFIIVNTCAVTKTAITKAKRLIHKAMRENPDAELFVAGCWAEVYKDEVKKTDASGIYGVGQIDQIVHDIQKKINYKKELNFYNKSNKLVSSDRTRYTIKIQDGCEQFCSYCIIPYTRGKLCSRGEDEIVIEVKAAIANGFKEIVFSGIHLGLYGVDTNTNLVSLLKKIIKLSGIGRLRLSSIEVSEVSSELIRLIASTNKICNHLHIPLQSGNDKILHLMNRPYDIKLFQNKISEIRSKIPLVAISTDVIVGFPGETDEDFRKTYNFIKQIDFSRLHIFPFSAHEKTPAAKMNNIVDHNKIKKRAHKLRLLGEELKKNYQEKFKGKSVEIIIENIKNSYCYGKSEYYIDYQFLLNRIESNNIVKIGSIITVKI